MVQRRRPDLDQSLIRARFRRPHVEDFAFDMQFIARPHRARPAEFVEADPDDAAGGLEFALHQEPHGDRRSMPAARRQPAEHRALGRLLVEMKGLRIEFGRKGHDPCRIEHSAARTINLPGGEVLEISPVHTGPPAAMTARRGGHAIRPNQAPPATAPALTSPKVASASPSARNTPPAPNESCKATHPPPTAIASRNAAAMSAHPSRPAPCDAK